MGNREIAPAKTTPAAAISPRDFAQKVRYKSTSLTMPETPTITPTAIPDGPKRRTQQSTRLLHEWAVNQPWESAPLYEYRLGPTVQLTNGVELTPAVEAMLRRSNWFADLVGRVPGAIWVIEAKMDPDPGAIGQAIFYSRLVMSTPRLNQGVNVPIQPVVLFAADDSEVREFALSLGVLVEVYTPPWYENYLITKRFRRRQANIEGANP